MATLAESGDVSGICLLCLLNHYLAKSGFAAGDDLFAVPATHVWSSATLHSLLYSDDDDEEILSDGDVNSPAVAAAKPVARSRNPAASKAKAKPPAAPVAGQYFSPCLHNLQNCTKKLFNRLCLCHAKTYVLQVNMRRHSELYLQLLVEKV